MQETFANYKKFVANQTENSIKCLDTDNGTEYVNKNFQIFLKASGIRHQNTVPYSPQQNGLAKRMNQAIVEKARHMLIGTQLSTEYWWLI